MATAVEHSSPHILAEHALPVACSAACYDRIEDVGILAVVIPKREFRQIQRQIVLADVVIRAHDATLQQAPEVVQVRGMDVPAHIFTAAWLTVSCGKRTSSTADSRAIHRSPPTRHVSSTVLFTKFVRVSASVCSMICATTLPLRAIAPITAIFPNPPAPGLPCASTHVCSYSLPPI